MTRSSVRTFAALLALAAVLIVFVYPTVNLPATKLKGPLVLAPLLLIFNVAAMLLLSLRLIRRELVIYTPRPTVPIVDLLCTRLC